jgi:fatty acid desaturase
MSRPPLPPDLLQRVHLREEGKHGRRALIFLLLYALGAAAAVVLAGMSGSVWTTLALLPCYVLAAASLHGVSLFTHEAVHGTLSENRRWNALLGAVCAWPVLQNYSAYRVLHLRHHDHLGEEGDPDHYANYTRWTWMVFIMNWLRLLIGYPVYITMIPVLGFRHGSGRERVAILAEVAAVLALVALAWKWVPSAWLLHGWLIPMICINFMVNIRGMSQHTLLEHADDEIRGTRSILTHPVVRFFMCNENYHLEHHLYPGVPWHQLPAVHEALEKPLREHGAPYIPSYSAFVREFIRGSLERSPLGPGRKP